MGTYRQPKETISQHLIYNICEMSENSAGLPDFAAINAKALSDVENYYGELTTILSGLDPIKLLSQLTLTFGTVPENQFNDESSDIHKWARWLEFTAGFLLTHSYPDNARKEIVGDDLKSIEDLLTKYFAAVSLGLMSYPHKPDNREIDAVVSLAKNDSLYVRGESYPHQLRKVAQDMWSQHEDWFIQNLGFTIDDALSLSESIMTEINRRLNDEKESCKIRARQHVDEMITNGEAKEEERNDLEIGLGCYYYFGNADVILSFTLDDLTAFSTVSKDRCGSYLKRLSQEFGYKNKNHLSSFLDSHLAPWDYNTLYERPIVSYDNRYFIPVPSLLNEVLLHTFYYDLIVDTAYWKNVGEKKYGACLEEKTADLLKRVFPPGEVLLNPKYPGGNELCDVLVLHDRNVFIIQCKAKRLRYESRIGSDSGLIRDDLNKAVADSFEQGRRARDYLSNNQPAKIIIGNGNIEIDSKQISDIFLLSVTLGSYPHLITRLANINRTLNLFSDNQYPWAISLFDLGVVTELIESPSTFIHYGKRRLAVERTNFDIFADEVDLLGFYFSQGLSFDTKQFKKINALLLSGFSEDIDKYMFEKHELGKQPHKPEANMPPKFKEYIQSIEQLESPYKTNCIVRLLDCDYKLKELFVNTTEKIKQQTRSDDSMHSFSTGKKDNTIGFSFISMNADSLDALFKQVFSFSVMKKYVTRCKEWVGLGWDKKSGKMVDVAVFQSYDWIEDSVISKLAGENLKPGEMMDLGD